MIKQVNLADKEVPGHLDMAPEQSLCKALRIVKIYNTVVAEMLPESRRAKLPSQ